MPKIPIIKGDQFIDYLIKFGCKEVSVRGSHHKIRNPENGKVSVIAVHSGKDIDSGSFSGVIQQLGIDLATFVGFVND